MNTPQTINVAARESSLLSLRSKLNGTPAEPAFRAQSAAPADAYKTLLECWRRTKYHSCGS